MFRNMRRKKQVLSREAVDKILYEGTSGVLAVLGDDGYPYAVPLSYVYDGYRIYFHSAKSGHKMDAIGKGAKVSFCVINRDDIIPAELTTYFSSVVVFGRARIIEDPSEKRRTLELVGKRYSPQHQKESLAEIEKLFNQVCMVAIDIEHVSGKEAIELVNNKSLE